MNKYKNYIVIGIIALVLVAGLSFGAVSKVSANQDFWNIVAEKLASQLADMLGVPEEMQGMVGASGTRFPHGISADSTSPSAGEVRGTTLTSTGAATIGGAATVGSTLGVTGVLTASTLIDNTQGFAGDVYASSTGLVAAGSLTEADLLAYEYFKITANKAGGFALTLPATSTMTTLIPNAGDWKEICIENATSSTQALTITAGTGIRLVATDANQDVIDATEVSCIKFIRENDTDVLGVMTNELVDVD